MSKWLFNTIMFTFSQKYKTDYGYAFYKTNYFWLLDRFQSYRVKIEPLRLIIKFGRSMYIISSIILVFYLFFCLSVSLPVCMSVCFIHRYFLNGQDGPPQLVFALVSLCFMFIKTKTMRSRWYAENHRHLNIF